MCRADQDQKEFVKQPRIVDGAIGRLSTLPMKIGMPWTRLRETQDLKNFKNLLNNI